MNFNELIQNINQINNFFKQKAISVINISLTTRNWLTGSYIVEFEQNGKDRAKYGTNLISEIAKQCKKQGLKGYSNSNLKYFRQFYLTYLQIGQSIIGFLKQNSIGQSPIGFFDSIEKKQLKLKSNKNSNLFVSPQILITKLSYTHLIQLIGFDDNLKRTFYEIECINGNWSVKELKRQIGSLLYERTGLSINKQKVIDLINKTKTEYLPENIIRDPYVFEFLGLKQQNVFTESKLESLLIANLQGFILELGKGFCFEARQKRIQIDNEYFYIDLVFYHKILKCNVLIELKTRKFHHSDISQLNVYLNYYKKYEMQVDDNPPVGILLCTSKNEELVEFATAGLDRNLFVTKYQLQLPSKQELQNFVKTKLMKKGQ